MDEEWWTGCQELHHFPRLDKHSNVYLANVSSETIISQHCPSVYVCKKLQIQQMHEVPKEKGAPETAWPSVKFFFSSFLCF